MEDKLFMSELKKIEDLVNEESMTATFISGYPLELIVQPVQGIVGQQSMLEAADEDTPFNSPDARMTLTFTAGDIDLQIYGRMNMSDDLYRKIRTAFKNACIYWCCAIHKNAITAGTVMAERFGGDQG
jgi:hypothetical protein